VTVEPISDPAYALLRIFSNACNVAASHLTSLLPIAGQSLASIFSRNSQIPCLHLCALENRWKL
jgi:hypothetical protein